MRLRLAARLETPLAERAGRLAEDLRGIAAREGELRRAVADADVRALAAERRAGDAPRRRAATPEELRVRGRGALGARRRGGREAAEAAAERARPRRGRSPDADPGRARRPGELVLTRLAAGAERLERSLARRRRAIRSAGARARRRRRRRARPSSALTLRRLGADEVELRQQAVAGRRAAGGDRRRAGAHGRRARRGAAPARRRAAAEPAEGDGSRRRSPRSSSGTSGAASSSARSTRSPRRSTRPRRSGLQELAVQRADLEASLDELEKLRDDLTSTVETRFAETFAAVEQHFHDVAATLFPGGEGRLRLTEAEEDGEEAGHRGRAAAGREARHAAVAALRRREGARCDRVPLLALPGAAEPVLSPRRGRSGARRHEHRPFHRAAAHVRRPRAVHRDHAPEADDGGGGRPLRRDDGRRRRLADRLAAPAARRRGRRDGVNDLDFVLRAVDRLLVATESGPGSAVAGAKSCAASSRRGRTPISTCSTRPATGSASTSSSSTGSTSRVTAVEARVRARGRRASSCYLVERDERGWFTRHGRSTARLAGRRLRDERPHRGRVGRRAVSLPRSTRPTTAPRTPPPPESPTDRPSHPVPGSRRSGEPRPVSDTDTKVRRKRDDE